MGNTHLKKFNTMELRFVEFGKEAKGKGFYIQHIRGDLHYLQLKKGDTYNTLFDKLRNMFTHEASKKAANEWVDSQFENTEDHSVFDTSFEEDVVATFNLMPYA